MPEIVRRRITKRLIDALQPPEGEDLIIWDTSVSGFRLRIRRTGRKVYEVRYRSEGSVAQRQITIGRHGSPWTPETARDQAKAILYAAGRGEDPLETRQRSREAVTVAALCEAYLRDGPAHKPTKRESSWRVDRYSFEHHLIPVLGHRVAKSLKPADLAEWQAKVAAGGTARRYKTGKPRSVVHVRGGRGAATRAMRCAAAMLAWAVKLEILDVNPAEKVAKFPDVRRERYLSDEESVAIWRAIDELLAENRLTVTQAGFFRMLMLTGARRGEMLGLRWGRSISSAEWCFFRQLGTSPEATHVPRPCTCHQPRWTF